MSASPANIPAMGEPLQPMPNPGWYKDPLGQGRRYWDGQAWTDHNVAPMTSDERGEILNREIMMRVAEGWRVEGRGPYQAVLVRGQKPNHVLHAILTIFTCCFWGIVWAIVAGGSGETRKVVEVDPNGQVIYT